MEEPPASLNPEYLLGGFIVELLVSFGLYGIFVMQTYIYLVRFPRDGMKLIVFLLWLLETAHTGFVGRAVYYYTVQSIQQPHNLTKIHWSIVVVLWIEIGVVALVQGIYIRRIWILSEGRLSITGLATSLYLARIGFLSISAYDMNLHPTWQSFRETQSSNICVETAVALSVAVDMVVAISTVYYCRKHMYSEARTSKLESILSSLIIFAIHSSLATSAVSLSIVLTYIYLTHNLVFVGLACVVAKLYSNCLLAMLNARKGLRLRMAGTAVDINMDALNRA